MHPPHEDALYDLLGDRLRQARRAVGLTQAELGRLVGLSRTSITNIERGTQHPPLHVIYQLAVAVQTSPSDLLPDPADLPPALDGLVEGLSEADVDWVREIVVEARKPEEDAR